MTNFSTHLDPLTHLMARFFTLNEAGVTTARSMKHYVDTRIHLCDKSKQAAQWRVYSTMVSSSVRSPTFEESYHFWREKYCFVCQRDNHHVWSAMVQELA